MHNGRWDAQPGPSRIVDLGGILLGVAAMLKTLANVGNAAGLVITDLHKGCLLLPLVLAFQILHRSNHRPLIASDPS